MSLFLGILRLVLLSVAQHFIKQKPVQRYPCRLNKGEKRGSYVYDSNGKKYLDALAGLWCTALGGNEPRLVEAATKQLNKLPFYHSFWNRTTRPSLDLAKEILEIFTARKMGKVFFTNSGSEANDSQVQAVIKKYDILFIADEVITAFGRLGTMFGCDKYHIQPDLVSIAKALSSAYMPIGAILVSPEISEVIHSQSSKLGSFSHGFTYSGHPVACAVALEALKIYKERNIVEKVQAISPRFQNGIKSFSESPIIGELIIIYGDRLRSTERIIEELKSQNK
ncbi:hypothetical protein J5N97_017858 [Dioscorea zingiberensis]|uniref:Uncharacterized protein n=1 Tax=Dioscorea zingiberensis TaxID=325984 RepID=A0A9D5CP03_9LILI|nr:hypothetical protein J5N97_017858 [Dioscorea zingiberensis]